MLDSWTNIGSLPYHTNVHQLRLLRLLLQPSLLSFTLSSFTAAGILVVATWSHVSSHNLLYGYLFGQYGLTTILKESPNTFSAINTAFSSSSSIAYDIAIGVFAVLVGLLVYALLQSLDHMLADAGDALQEIAYAGEPVKKSVKKEVGLRLGLRVINCIVWCVYWIFFVNVLLPLCLVVAKTAGDSGVMPARWPEWTYTLLGFSLLLLTLHLHVIFLRLLVLRPRVFGGENIVAGSDSTH